MLSRIGGKVVEVAVVVVLTIGALQFLTNGTLLDAGPGFPPKPEECTSGGTLPGDDSGTLYAGDANGNGEIALNDALWILNSLFTAGYPKPAEVCAGTDVPWDKKQIDKITSLIDSINIVDVEEPSDDKVTYKTIQFEGVNVQIVSGDGATNGNPDDPYTTATAEVSTNGLGNLIIGYNHPRTEGDPGSDPELGDDPVENFHTGSHNLIIGDRHNYSSYAGVVAGRTNEVTGAFSSVTGGYVQVASGLCSSVCGGCSNTASANFANVTGGRHNTASAAWSHVSGGGGPDEGLGNGAGAVYSCIVGGETNEVEIAAIRSVIVGGQLNTTTALNSTILGGSDNIASGDQSAVCGGQWNVASGDWSVVAGGGAPGSDDGNIASGDRSVVSGGCTNEASAAFSAVNGGRNNIASGDWSSILGGGGTDATEGNEASGFHSTVAGGASHTASGDKSAVSGGEWNVASGDYATVAGGGAGEEAEGNEAAGAHSTVSGGCTNTATAGFSHVVGGQNNITEGLWSVIVGGGSGEATDGNLTESGASHVVVVGGLGNSVTGDGDNGVILGGVGNSLEDSEGCLGCEDATAP